MLPGIASRRAVLLSAPSLARGLVSYWRLDEASGTRVDSVGGNNLTSNNGVGSAAGKIGNGASFVAASSQYLSIADTPSLESGGGTASFTYSAWVFANSYPDANANIVLAKHANGSGAEYELNAWPGNAWQWYLYNGAPGTRVTGLDFGGVPPTSQWVLLVVGYDVGAQKAWASLNGAAKTYGNAQTGTPATTANPFTIGWDTWVTGTRFWNGVIDEVGRWSRVLSDAEIVKLYNGGAGVRVA